MDAENKQALQSKIDADIELLKSDIVKLKQLTQPIAPDGAIGRVSRMEAIGEKSVNEAALRNAEARLAKLQRALSHIDNPDFGQCRECGKDIPLGRIMLMPESDKCVECAE